MYIIVVAVGAFFLKDGYITAGDYVAYLLFVYCDEEEFNDLISKYLD